MTRSKSPRDLATSFLQLLALAVILSSFFVTPGPPAGGDSCCSWGGAYPPPDYSAAQGVSSEVSNTSLSITLAQLSSFDYDPVAKSGAIEANQRLPESVRRLDGRYLKLTGYMVPVEYSGDKVTGFIIVASQLQCCYGKQPKVNEWVQVRTKSPIEPVTEVPVTVEGTFHVVPEISEGKVVRLYDLDGAQLASL